MIALNPEITAALEARKPEIAASFERIVRGQFQAIVEKFGPTCRGAGNCWTWARVWTNTVSPYVAYGADRACTINDARLARGAAEYADAVVVAWIGKINEKLGEMDSAEACRMSVDGDRFLIVGTRGGKHVSIEQDRIVNASPKGTVFNQFPARIYVEGKFTSAAAYKRAFAG